MDSRREHFWIRSCLSPSVCLFSVLSLGVAACHGATAPPAPNRPPVIIKPAFVGPDPVCPGQSSGLGLVADDPDNDDLTVTWTASGGTIGGDGPMVAWNAPDTAGTYTVHATVSDGRGGEVSSDVDVHVENGMLLAFSTHDGLATVAADGTWKVVIPGGFRGIGVWNGRAYLQAFLPGSSSAMAMCAADLTAGTVDCGPTGEYSVAAGHLNYGERAIFLPDGGLGVLAADSVAVWRGDGSLWETRNVTLYSADATVMGGQLIVCCTDQNQILTTDLVKGGFGTYSPLSIDRATAAVEGRLLFAVVYAGGQLYYGANQFVMETTYGGGVKDLISTAPDDNVTGMVVMGHDLYAALNLAGKIYRVDLTSGASEVFAQGLYMPTQLACLPGGGG